MKIIGGRSHYLGGFDVESYGGLDGVWGEPLCISFKPVGKPPNTIRVADFTDIAEWCVQVQNEFAKYWHLFGWYSQYHDLKYLRTVFAQYEVVPATFFFHQDLIKLARKYHRMPNNRLDTWGKMYSKTSKTVLEPEIWRAASKGDTASMDYVVEHCESDLRIMEDIYDKVLVQHACQHRWDKELL